MNAPELAGKISADGGRCDRLAKSSLPPQEIIDELYLATFARRPSADELDGLLAEFAKPQIATRRLVEDLLWAMLNSPEFIYKD
jgi:hypothetical protein